MNGSNFIKQITVPKIVQPVQLAGYSEQLTDAPPIHVWVNPPQNVLDAFAAIQTDLRAVAEAIKRAPQIKGLMGKRRWQKLNEQMQAGNRKLYAWLAEIWSQHEDPATHVTPADVEAFAHKLAAEDLALWRWVTEQTYSLIVAHSNRELLEKN